MSACDISSFGSGFESFLNKRRVELDFQQFDSFSVGQRVTATTKERGVMSGKIYRFCQASGRFFADVEFTLASLRFLRMIDLEELSVAAERDDLNLTRRRNEALKNGQLAL